MLNYPSKALGSRHDAFKGEYVWNIFISLKIERH
jgi:hypothetical protein